MHLRPWDLPGKSTGVGCHFLLQRIFPTQGSNLGLQHCRQMLYLLSHQLLKDTIMFSSDQFSSVVQSSPTIVRPMDWSMPGFPVHHQLPEFTQTHVHWVGDAIQPSHPLPLLLPPSIFPSIRVFSNESILHIRWPKYWSFSFSNSPSNEYSGLISFRMDWLDFLAVQGTLQVFSNTTVQKH